MPSNQTPNYKLSQWERADKVQMEDFNADNAKIDVALKAQDSALAAEASARQSADAAEAQARAALAGQLSKLGNCKKQSYQSSVSQKASAGGDPHQRRRDGHMDYSPRRRV